MESTIVLVTIVTNFKDDEWTVTVDTVGKYFYKNIKT